MGRLITTARSLETGVDALQAEFAAMYDDSDKRKAAMAEQSSAGILLVMP
jgi:hypothetical protein